MTELSRTPEPPYYCVTFVSQLGQEQGGYAEMALIMENLARQQSGFLGMDSVRDQNGTGITLSYWTDEASILDWKNNLQHLQAQKLGQEKWYTQYRLHISRVERSYQFDRPAT